MSAGRRTLRERKVAQRIAVVDEHTRKKAAQERLDAYEADNEAGDDARGPAGSDDDEFVIAGDEDEEDEEVEISGKRKKKRPPSGAPTATKRKLRTGGVAAQRVPKTFSRLLEEAGLDRVSPGTPTYFTAQAGPPQASAPRKFCSVCGNMSSYKCARCGSLYCSRRCLTTHSETRCLKLIT